VWIKPFLHQSKVGHIAHLAGEQPFITPTNFLYDEHHHRIYFHSNVTGRTRFNLEHHPLVCFETSEYGRLLPSNAALEFSMQYRSVMVFGRTVIVTEPSEKRQILENLIKKYFPEMRSGVEYRPITQKELHRTAVYAIEIMSWSGKENWQDQAIQTKEWNPLPEILT
jgi:uncharacterized protein